MRTLEAGSRRSDHPRESKHQWQRSVCLIMLLSSTVVGGGESLAQAQSGKGRNRVTQTITTTTLETASSSMLPVGAESGGSTFPSATMELPGVEHDGFTTDKLVTFGTTGSLSAAPLVLDVAQDAEFPTTAASPMNRIRGALYWGEIGDRGGLSVQRVLAVALQANPNLETYTANRAAAKAELIRALQYPNPTAQVDIGGETARETDESGSKPSRTTYEVALSQPIEMPGKRLARRVEAEAGFAVVEGERQEFMSSLRADVVEAYFTVQYHGAMERLHTSILDVANSLLQIATTRVEIGEAGRLELLNARVEVLRAQRERNAARRRGVAARAALDALAGGRLGRDFRLSDSFTKSLRSYTMQSTVDAALSRHPRLVRLAAELEQRYTTLDRAKTEWWPDINVGVRQSREFDTNGAAATIGVEIPLWSRNQGGVARASADAQKTYNDIVIALNDLRRDAVSTWQNLQLAREQIASYDGGIREASEEAVTLAYEQYQLGDAGFTDVLIARRNLQEAQQGLIQAYYDASLAQARLERARGAVMEIVPAAPPKKAGKSGAATGHTGERAERSDPPPRKKRP